MDKYTSAIIVAAGNSTRMGSSISKTLLELNGKPAIYYSLHALQQCEEIREIVIVCREQDKEKMNEIGASFSKFKCSTSGGETRTDSVLNGVNCADDLTTHFCIHDGARALITTSDITKVVKEAYTNNAATLGTKIVDTIKIINDDLSIESTPDRSKLYAVQTPQVFEKSIYMEAVENAKRKNLSVTDDCSLVEAISKRVQIVEGSLDNIKLTTQNDLLIAQFVLERRN